MIVSIVVGIVLLGERRRRHGRRAADRDHRCAGGEAAWVVVRYLKWMTTHFMRWTPRTD
ncbi:MAG: hypothetical protein R2713_00505 [Ilumatobacteraceae bacterium]